MASATARRHQIAVPLLFAWRKAYREGGLGIEAPSFYPVRVDGIEAHAGEDGVPPEPPENGPASRVEIVLYKVMNYMLALMVWLHCLP